MPRLKNDDPFYAQELPGLDGLNAVSANCKHEEDVYHYIEEKGMSTCEKIVYILQKGSDTQRGTVLDHLDVSIAECSDEEVSTVIQELNECMWQLETHLQIAGAEALIRTIPLVSPKVTSEVIELTETMLQLKEEKIREPWSDVYMILLKHVPQEVVEGRLASIALDKGRLSEPLHNRLLCCRLIGGLCERAPSPEFITQFLDLSIALCQDTDLVVRACMCSQLNAIARTLGQPFTKDVIMRELFELLNDEEGEVAKVAFASLMGLVEVLDATYRVQHAYPVIKQYVQDPPAAVQEVLQERFGEFVHAVRAEITLSGEADALLFARYFAETASSSQPTVRRSCAFNLPAVAASLPPHLYTPHLHPLLLSLTEDTHLPTRVSIAAGLHELVKLLGPKAFQLFKNVFATLLQDKEPAVQDRLIENLAVVLDAFDAQVTGPEEKEKYFSRLVPPLLAWWQGPASSSLRRLELLYLHIHRFPVYFNPSLLHTTFLPPLLKQLSSGPRALLSRCASATILFCRKMANASWESEIFSKLISDFAKSRSYWDRLAFIEVCRASLDVYSRKYFRERLLTPLLDLASDPVSSVRRRLCLLLPSIKHALRPPAEVEHLATLIQVVSNLQVDSNPEVLEAIGEASAEIDAIEKAMKQSPGSSGSEERDPVDQAREVEEQVLKEAALEQDKLERRQKIREMLQNEKAQQEQQGTHRKFGGKRASGESTRLPPAPNGSVVRQPVGGVGPRCSGGNLRAAQERRRNGHNTPARLTSAAKR